MRSVVLVAEDDDAYRQALRRGLERAGFEVVEGANGRQALDIVDLEPVDLVLTDLQMPEVDGLGLLSALRETRPELPVILMSGVGTLETAVKAVRLGATDFLEKPVGFDRLIITLENALALSDLRRRAVTADAGGGAALLGESRAMVELRQLIAKVGPTDARILVLGENGTGKELVATALHAASSRRSGPLVKLNCAAVPAELVESELFGHEKGAFTGASRTRRGRFEEASGGTLFLDEVGDMPMAMQAKLLRVLQEGELERVGGGRTIEVDVRVVAATNRDPGRLVAGGSFREDLFYRLNVFTLTVPPLRERLEDVPLLATHFARATCQRAGRRLVTFTERALDVLRQHDYPGNVRELANRVERLVILTERDSIDADDVQRGTSASVPAKSLEGARYETGRTLRELLRDAERQILVAAIMRHGGNKSATARALDVDRSHFYKKCAALGID
jgi:DNA-binding NtrC family response regulator